jgi:type I restriction enzyme S subunit
MLFYKETNFKDTEIGRLPNDWEVVKVGDVLSLEYGKGLPETERIAGMYPVVGSNGIVGYHNQAIVKGPGIVVGRKGTIGAVSWIDKDFWPIDTTYYVKTKISDVFLKWLFYELIYLNPARFHLADVVPGLKRELVHSLKMPLPPLLEQRKIAEILSTVDGAIQKTDEVIAKTERLKKGLMQELLTKGIGHREFKDTEIGRVPKHWKVVKIGDVAQTSSGGTPSRAKREYYGGDIPWVKSSELKDNIICDTEEKITKEGLENSSAKIFPKGTLLIAMYGATVGKTGILGIDAATNQAICAILPNKIFDPYFLMSYIIFRRDRLIFVSSGGAQPNISQEIIRAFKVSLPSISEQQRIAEILSIVDKKLEIEKNEKAKLERIKRRLMDLLLTGKIRVKVNHIVP